MARVIVVGAGPAGLACALRLARAGIEVTLLEGAAAGARRRPCGEGLLPPGVRELAELGVLARMRVAEMSPFTGISYWMEGAEAAAADFERPRGTNAAAWFANRASAELAAPPRLNGEPARRAGSRQPDPQEDQSARIPDEPAESWVGLGLSRPELELAFLELLAEERSARVVNACPVTDLVRRDAAVVGVRAGGREWMADAVVGADGLDSTVRRLIGAARVSRRARRFGVCGHFEWETPRASIGRVEVHLVDGGEVYRTPRGAAREGWIFLTDEATVRSWAGRMEERWLERLRGSAPLGRALVGARVVGPVAGVGPLHRPAGFTAVPGLLLIGDAAGFLDALTGEGLALGLRMARAAAELLLRSRCRIGPSEVARHEAAWRAATAHPWALTRGLLFLVRHRGLARRALARMRRHPDLMARLLAVNCGEASLADWTPGELARWLAG